MTSALTPCPPVYLEARLAHRGLARTAVSVEELEAQGYEAGQADPRYGSVWCLKPIEEEQR